MNLLSLFVIVLRLALVVLAAVSLIKKQWKQLLPLALVFALTYLPALLLRFAGLRLDPLGELLYHVLLFMSMYLGSAANFYDRFAWWDILIHFLAGGLFVNLGVALVRRMGQLDRLPTLVFGFTLSITLHVFWEVLEYVSDSLFHSDHQRWQKRNPDHNHQPEAAIQPPGLVDTMNDTLICMLGTVVACLAWWFIL